MIYIIMGVSGSGKSKVGIYLSEKLKWTLYEGDDFHPRENVDKMSQGEPLTDEDRFPWLLQLHETIQGARSSGSDVIVTCSALKRQYRQILLHGATAKDQGALPSLCAPSDVFFVFLHGDYDLIYQRMVSRRGHYMTPDMLRSQFDTLEPPLHEQNVLTPDIKRDVEDIAAEIEQHIIDHKS